jgi:hypothetical protein
VTIVFRSVKARSKDIGEQGNEVLKDPFGREIYRVEGLVFRKNSQEIQYKIGESHLDQAHRYLQEKYWEFWHEDKLSISHGIDLVEVTSEPDDKFRVLEPLVITLRPQLPEHRLPEKQGRKNYPPSKPVRNKKSLFRLVLFAITALLLTGIVWKVWSDSQLPSICLYVTQDVPIEFNPLNQKTSSPEVLSGIERLKKLKKEHEIAWIWLNGSLDVETSLANQIKTEVNKHIEKTRKVGIITIVPDGNNKLTIKNHPIDSAIALLQKQTVTSGKLDATIIEPISPKASSCNALQMKESNHF